MGGRASNFQYNGGFLKYGFGYFYGGGWETTPLEAMTLNHKISWPGLIFSDFLARLLILSKCVG